MWDAIVLFEAYTLHLTRRHRDAGALYIDFKAAFPSVRHRWIKRVLRAMGLPSPIIHILNELYTNNLAEIYLRGPTACFIEILSGIRQGCPASGSIFALCVDPVIRKIVSRIPRYSSLAVAFADDIAIAMAAFLTLLPSIFLIMSVVKAATGMMLNFSKTYIMPLWTYCLQQAAIDIRPTHPEACLIKLTYAFKHLGVLTGPEAHQGRWSAPVAKFISRVANIRSTRCSTNEALEMYQPVAFSVLRFTARFADPPPEACFAESRAVARIMAAPMNAFTPELLSSLHILGGRPLVPNLSAVAWASQIKAIAASKRFPEILLLTDSRIDDDDDEEALLHPPWSRWRTRSISAGLRNLWELTSGSGTLRAIRMNPRANITADFVYLLLKSHPADTILNRMSNLQPQISTELATFYIHLRLECLSRARVPACLMYSALRCWCNAVPTARRFQGEPACCPFGCGIPQGNDMRHIARCPVIYLAALPLFGPAEFWPMRAGRNDAFAYPLQLAGFHVLCCCRA